MILTYVKVWAAFSTGSWPALCRLCPLACAAAVGERQGHYSQAQPTRLSGLPPPVSAWMREEQGPRGQVLCSLLLQALVV